MTLTDGAGETVAVGADLLLAGPVYADLGGNVALVRTAKGDLIPILVGDALARSSVALQADLLTLESTVESILTSLLSKQPLDGTLTALAALNSTAGLLEQTGVDTFTKRAMGVAASTSIPTRADADARFAAISHAHAGSDISSGTVAAARLPVATTSAQGIVELATNGENAANVAVQGNDSRLGDARTPTAHEASHKHGGSDEVATATAASNAIPKAGAGGTLAAGWLPALTGAITSTAGSATTAYGSIKANAFVANMTGAAAVPVAMDAIDAFAALHGTYGFNKLLPAWDVATAAFGTIMI